MVVARQHKVEEAAVIEFEVDRAFGMDDCNDHVGPLCLEILRAGQRRLEGGREDKVVTGAGQRGAVFFREADEAHLQPADVANFGVLETGERLPAPVPQVGGEEREPGLAHPRTEHLLSEVEFMIAGGEDVRWCHVGQGDRVFALVEAGEQGGRDQVPGMGIDYIAALGALGFHNGIQPREATASGVILDVVDIIGEQEGEVHRFRPRLRGETCSAEQGGDQEVARQMHGSLHKSVFRIHRRDGYASA